MNVLVTGANGQLGNEMRVINRDSAERFVYTDVNQVEGNETIHLDITDIDAVRSIVKKNKIDVIVNCAAYTNVDAAEENEPFAEMLNAKAPQNLAVVASENNALLVHVSTDYVFGKEPYNRPCREDQQGTPTGVYGMTKLHGEENIMASGCKYVIIRTAWLYSEYGKNFCKTMLNLTSSKPRLKVVFDQVGTPTYALDLAKAIMAIIADYSADMNAQSYAHTGIYHYSNEGVCSWFDFTKMIAEYSGHTVCSIEPCHSNEFPSPVVRPSYSVLDKTKIKETFGISVPYWTDSLRKCIENIKGK